MNNTIINTNTNYTLTTATTVSNSARIQYLVCDLGTAMSTMALLWLRVESRMSKLRLGQLLYLLPLYTTNDRYY